jgi:Tfp pilus assembly protein PilF
MRTAVIVTYTVYGVLSFAHIGRMWGFNHLGYLPPSWIALYALGGGALAFLLFGGFSAKRCTVVAGLADTWIWSGGAWRRLMMAVVALIVFASCRVPTHLLGDGYTCLAIFGSGEGYVHKWAEPGSIWLIRQLQASFGGFTRETALLAFQSLSITSGGVFVLGVLILLGDLTREATLRLFALTTVLFGGSALLFFGYVEFYAPVWAATAMFLATGIRYVRNKGRLWAPLLAFSIAVAMHVEAVYFTPALVYLLVAKAESAHLRRIYTGLAFAVTAAAIATFVWLYLNRVEFEVMILPFFHSRPEYPGYTVFSAAHFLDVVNEILLIAPGAFLVMALWVHTSARRRWNREGFFLAAASTGALSFFFLFAGATTMGRDWDVMSLSLLSPVLLGFNRMSVHHIRPGARLVLANLVLLVLTTGAFLGIAFCTECSETRFRSLMTDHNWNGWIILSTHYERTGRHDMSVEVLREMERRIPDRRALLTAYDYLESGRIGDAERLAADLLSKNPYSPHFMQLTANVFRKKHQPDSAEYFYTKALRLMPYHAPLMNELAQLYIDERRFDEGLAWATEAHSLEPEKTFITETLALVHIRRQDYGPASALADTLLQNDPNSAGAHLIKMTVALNNGDYESASAHYREFLRYGGERSDYERIRDHYKGLSDWQ